MANNRHEVALAPRLDLEHAEAGLGVVERDALDRPGERLDGLAAVELPWRHPLIHCPRLPRQQSEM
ncbi:hypothetical protein ACRAWG_28715 [Methylobacterium sp. P31]